MGKLIIKYCSWQCNDKNPPNFVGAQPDRSLCVATWLQPENFPTTTGEVCSEYHFGKMLLKNHFQAISYALENVGSVVVTGGTILKLPQLLKETLNTTIANLTTTKATTTTTTTTSANNAGTSTTTTKTTTNVKKTTVISTETTSTSSTSEPQDQETWIVASKVIGEHEREDNLDPAIEGVLNITNEIALSEIAWEEIYPEWKRFQALLEYLSIVGEVIKKYDGGDFKKNNEAFFLNSRWLKSCEAGLTSTTTSTSSSEVTSTTQRTSTEDPDHTITTSQPTSTVTTKTSSSVSTSSFDDQPTTPPTTTTPTTTTTTATAAATATATAPATATTTTTTTPTATATATAAAITATATATATATLPAIRPGG